MTRLPVSSGPRLGRRTAGSGEAFVRVAVSARHVEASPDGVAARFADEPRLGGRTVHDVHRIIQGRTWRWL